MDVFFVLSGFLITGQLLKEVDRTGTVDLPAFYGRRAKRLLPAATMVLLFTAIGTWLIFPITRFKDIAWDIGTSAVYLINWRLADQSVDYLAEDTLPSPVQHYWSLAVEEQFYVVWPLVLLVVGLVVTRTRRPLAPVATIGLLAIAVPSLVWSVLHTADSPDTAYFVTTTRLWELALGGLVACGAAVWPRIAPPHRFHPRPGRARGPARQLLRHHLVHPLARHRCPAAHRRDRAGAGGWRRRLRGPGEGPRLRPDAVGRRPELLAVPVALAAGDLREPGFYDATPPCGPPPPPCWPPSRWPGWGTASSRTRCASRPCSSAPATP
ncbi:hypothetical protein BJF82_10080 [Kytococcus sp. CUA-901]|nr:hypothetical protein BJF82_10080 [Kytococcus sp. CUA-901]